MTNVINIANYADDTTPFVSGDTPLNVWHFWKMWLRNVLNGLPIKANIKANHDKCHLPMSTVTPITDILYEYP